MRNLFRRFGLGHARGTAHDGTSLVEPHEVQQGFTGSTRRPRRITLIGLRLYPQMYDIMVVVLSFFCDMFVAVLYF